MLKARKLNSCVFPKKNHGSGLTKKNIFAISNRYYHVMKGLATIFLFFLSLTAFAQKPPRLVPVVIAEMVPVDSVDNQDTRSNPCSGWVDTNIRFTACRNVDGVVGYLLEPKNDTILELILLDTASRRCGIGLSEVQRAEVLFAKVMDLRVDSAQRIHRAFTAPRFYQYVRQYVFFLNSDGDTCVHINCIMREESNCPPSPGRRYVVVSDGDDYYWTADLNLTRNRLLSCRVNGPTLHFVDGRNDEPRGIYREAIFERSWSWVEKSCKFDQLPDAVQQAVLSQTDTAQVSFCQHFSPKYVWKSYKKKNGEEVVKRKRYKSGNYYRVCMDTLCLGYNAKGRMLYVGTEPYLGWIDRAYLSHIPGIDVMIAEIVRDLSTRGRDFSKYGGIRWAEQVGNRYVLAVVYRPPVRADDLILYYTFDRNGRIEGVTLENWW